MEFISTSRGIVKQYVAENATLQKYGCALNFDRHDRTKT